MGTSLVVVGGFSMSQLSLPGRRNIGVQFSVNMFMSFKNPYQGFLETTLAINLTTRQHRSLGRLHQARGWVHP